MKLNRLSDPPWMGLCEEDYEEQRRVYDEEYEDYLSEEIDEKWEQMRNELRGIKD